MNVVVLTTYIISRYIVNKRNILNSNITTIICGDSHTKTAINDDVINDAINVSIASQTYYWTYEILTRLLETNRNIERVILSYSYHSLSFRLDKYNMTSISGSSRRTYALIADSKQLWEMAKSDLFGFFTNVVDTSITHIIKVIKGAEAVDMYYIGEYYPMYTNNLTNENVVGSIHNHYYINGRLQNISEEQIRYLLKIDTLCQTYNVQLYVVNTPINSRYSVLVPIKFRTIYNKVAMLLQCEILDYGDYIMSDSCYANADHLNASGAEIFTNIVIEEILNK